MGMGRRILGPALAGGRRAVTRRPVVPVVVLGIGAVAAASVFALTRSGGAEAGRIVVSSSQCGLDWVAPRSGRTVFTVENTTPRSVFSVVLANTDQSRIYGQIERLEPSTELPLDVVLPPGEYMFVCATNSGYSLVSPSREVRGRPVPDAHPYTPVSGQLMQLAALDYNDSLRPLMRRLAHDTDRLDAAVEAGHLETARRLWVPAHLDYAKLGVAYDTFGRFDDEIDQRPTGLPGGVHDSKFRGFLRLEYGLWHGESRASLEQVAAALDRSVHGLVRSFPKLTIPPGDLSLRAHEILENTLQFELTGATDEGSHTNLGTAWANVRGTQLAVDALRPALRRVDPRLARDAVAGLDRLGTMLASHRHADGGWAPLASLTAEQREGINGATSGLLEQLELIPDRLQPAPWGGDAD
jgi:high-affinity iron transporter